MEFWNRYSNLIDTVGVSFYRSISPRAMEKWESKRNTGFKLSWHFIYSSLEEATPYYHHGSFIKLANILHEGNEPKRLWERVKNARNLLFYDKTSRDFPKCRKNYRGGLLDFRYITSLYKQVQTGHENVSLEPLYPDTITDGTLEEAARIYFYLVHCPENIVAGLEVKRFYDDLIQLQSLKTILLTFGKKEKNLLTFHTKIIYILVQ